MRVFQADSTAAMLGHLGAISLKNSHDIVILSFCNIVKGQANYTDLFSEYEYQNLCQILESVFGFGSSFDFIGI